MSISLSNLRPAAGSTHKVKRIGRGTGSGHGGTSTRGHKGAQSRSGYSRKIGFEGGQMPMKRRIPKFGFTSPFRVEYQPLSLDNLALAAERIGGPVTPEGLRAIGMLKGQDTRVKLLNNGEISTAVTLHIHAASKSAIAAVQAAGGSVTVDERKKTTDSSPSARRRGAREAGQAERDAQAAPSAPASPANGQDSADLPTA